MAEELQAVDVTDSPTLRELVEEVVRAHRPKRLLVGGTEAEVVVRPAKARRGRVPLTSEQRKELLRASFGAWKGLIDPDQLKRELNELQRDDSQPRSW